MGAQPFGCAPLQPFVVYARQVCDLPGFGAWPMPGMYQVAAFCPLL